ncbi:MAG: hypothetical protein MUF81_08785, partial [Verrucomicrobia bacterium]|nr:hypothetical protein [Verrucomicrobiota bacterium]
MKTQDNWHSHTQRLVLTCLLFAATFHSRATTIQWINSDGGNWSVATNWSPAQAPGPADTADITASGDYTVSLDVDASIAGLNIGGAGGTQTFALSANTLTLSGDCVVGVNGRFQLSGGTLAGTNTLSGTMEWTAGTIGSNVVLTVGSNAVLTISGSGSKYLAGRLRNTGMVLWQHEAGGTFLSAGGIVENLAGGVFDVQSDVGFYGLAPGVFENDGVLRKTGGAGTFNLCDNWGMVLTNRGLVEVQIGKMEFSSGGSGDGRFQAATNTEVILSGGYTGLAGSAMDGLGWHSFSGGVFSGEMNAARLWLGQASLEGALTVTDEMSWTGGTIGSDAVLTVGSNAVLTISGSGSKY